MTTSGRKPAELEPAKPNRRRCPGWRRVAVLNLIAWAFLAVTARVLRDWVGAADPIYLAAALLALCFTAVSIFDALLTNTH
ncbi:MAG: hypothetical protein M1457_05705 [bacterium]|nr:hypothetical protein [bacterium]